MTPEGSDSIALPEATPRDREVQAVVLTLVEAYAFAEAMAVLSARLNEIRATRQTHLERVLLDWFDIAKEERPDFLTYAHHRRNPTLSEGAER